MRRRLIFAMVALVFGALILSGLASLFIASHHSKDQTRKQLVQEAQSLAYSVHAQINGRADPAVALRNLLTALQPTLRVAGTAVLGVDANGQLYNVPLKGTLTLPNGLRVADLNGPALAQLKTVSGSRGQLVYAAVPYRTQVQILGAPRDVVLVAVLTAHPPGILLDAGRWFALSSVIILLVAWLVAWQLGRRFVRPIQDAEHVTSRIAAGDLDARMPMAAGDDEEFVALSRSINQMAEGLAQAKGAERLFLQSVSHDLRTPLTSIRGFAEAIEDGATTDVEGAARVIASEARRLERLVADLLALATLEARRFTLQLQPTDLSAVATATAAGFIPAADELGLTITADTEDPVAAVADPDRLAQVTANLIENALRYANRQVKVTTTSLGNSALLYVEDDGPGISSEELPHVFDRLFTSGPRKDRPIGSGLGLTIVSELVSAMGGTVQATSPINPAGGTRMIVTLPAGPATDVFGPRPLSADSGSPPATRSSPVA
jgi:two-component system sensor histidine kinase BaeS